MSLIAPIGPTRVASIQPAMPGPGSDPSEDGLDIEPVMTPAPMGVFDDGIQIRPATATDDAASARLHPFMASAAPQITAIAPHLAGGRAQAPMGGANARIATGFDRTPAYDEPTSGRQLAKSTPVARAYAAWSR